MIAAIDRRSNGVRAVRSISAQSAHAGRLRDGQTADMMQAQPNFGVAVPSWKIDRPVKGVEHVACNRNQDLPNNVMRPLAEAST